jgi:GntR family transcriptional regulator
MTCCDALPYPAGVSIDDDSPDPAYRQLADILRKQIRDGAITGALPSMRSLRETYDLGEFAVQHALKVLVDEGLIFSVPRRGYYVRR